MLPQLKQSISSYASSNLIELCTVYFQGRKGKTQFISYPFSIEEEFGEYVWCLILLFFFKLQLGKWNYEQNSQCSHSTTHIPSPWDNARIAKSYQAFKKLMFIAKFYCTIFFYFYILLICSVECPLFRGMFYYSDGEKILEDVFYSNYFVPP